MCRPEVRNEGCVRGRPLGQIFGIECDVTVIVDVGFELLMAPVVERVGEQEAARRAAPVIDGNAGQGRGLTADLAGTVHVDHAEQRGIALADLAGDGALKAGLRPSSVENMWYPAA